MQILVPKMKHILLVSAPSDEKSKASLIKRFKPGEFSFAPKTENDVTPGDDYDCCVFILSKQSSESETCFIQWHNAIVKKIPFYVVLAQSLNWIDIPYQLRGRPYFDFKHKTDMSNLVNIINIGMFTEFDFDGLPKLLKPNLLIKPIERSNPLANIQHLRQSWLRAWHHAKNDTAFYDAMSFETFYRNLEANLLILSESILIGSFSFQPLQRISVPKQSALEVDTQAGESENRDLYYADPETSIVLQALFDLISPELDQLLDIELDDSALSGQTGSSHSPPKKIKVAYANRVLANMESREIFYDWHLNYMSFRQDVQTFAEENPDTYFLRTDIRKFYPTIDKEKLKNQVHKYVSNQLLWKYIDQYIDLSAINEQGEPVDVPGIPAGVPISHLLGNLYLHEIDVEMTHLSSRYFRYVDDVIFFSLSENDLQNLKAYFSTKLGQIGSGHSSERGLRLHPDKSVTGQSSSHEILSSIMDKLSGLVGLDLFEEIAGPYREQIGQSIYNTLISIQGQENEKEIEDIARYAAFALNSLKRLGYEGDLVSIAYHFLKKAPLRANVVRSLVRFLTDIYLETPEDAQFPHYIEYVASSYIKIAFLQILQSHENIADHAWDLVSTLMGDQIDLVAGEAAYTLTFNSNTEKMKVDFKDFHVKVTSNEYLAVRLLAFQLHVFGFDEQTLIRYINYQPPQIINTIISYLIPLAYQQGYDKIFDRFIFTMNYKIVVQLSYLVRAIVMSSALDEQKVNILEKFIMHLQMISRETAADLISIVDPGLFLNPMLKNAIDSTSSSALALARLENHINGETYYLGKYRELYSDNRLDNLHQQDYSCVRVEWQERNGYLEIVRDDLLYSRGFPTFLHWENYLKSLDKNSVITLYDIVQLPNGFSMVIYEVPRTYSTLNDWLENKQSFDLPFSSLDLKQKFEIIAAVNQCAEQTETQGGAFRFLTVHSNFVICSSNLDVQLVAIGSSLSRLPRYLVSSAFVNENDTNWTDNDTGMEAYSLFMGFLFFEIVAQRSPLTVLKTRSATQHIYLSDSLEIASLPAHAKGFLKRSTTIKSNYRYESYSTISKDIQHIINYLDKRLHLNQLTLDQAFSLEFVDFIRLRLRAHKRNPKLGKMVPEQRTYKLVRKMASDFDQFVSGDSARLDWMNSRYKSAINPSYITNEVSDWLSLPSRQLLRLVSFWEELLAIYNPIFGVHIDTKIICFSLYSQILFVEQNACMQTLGRTMRNYASQSDLMLPDLGGASGLRLSVSVPPVSNRTESFDFSAAEQKQVNSAIRAMFIDSKEFQANEYIKTIKAGELYLMVVGRALCIYNGSSDFVWSSNYSDHNRDSINSSQCFLALARIVRVFNRMVDTIFPIGNKDDIDAFLTEQSELPQSFDITSTSYLFHQCMIAIKTVTFAQRVNGTVLFYYFDTGTSEGIVRVTLPDYSQASKVFSQLDLVDVDHLTQTGPDIPATVDVYEHNGNMKIGSILTSPLFWFPQLLLTEVMVSVTSAPNSQAKTQIGGSTIDKANSTELDPETFDELVDILVSFASGLESPKIWVRTALNSDPIYHSIKFSGSTRELVTSLCFQLIDYGYLKKSGIPALVALIDATRKWGVGAPQDARLEELCRQIYPDSVNHGLGYQE
jgi:hypothetical protein